ncbi:calpain-9-like isoform 2-T2 [Menidia menidia]
MPPPGVCLNILEARSAEDGFGTVITPNPTFARYGMSRFDFGQGVLGNCWFLASIGALTLQNGILRQVVPVEQTFDEDYCGLFHFRFCRFGRWVDVVIDDKLPTIGGRLIFVHSKHQSEFWPALLEKAYAKLCGSYTDMCAGTPSEAMMDFTGGVHMSVRLPEPRPLLWELMCRAATAGALMSCGTPPGESSSVTLSPGGLVLGHAYTVTGVRQVASRGRAVHVVRLWNPWGRGEWTGDWSDGSSLWQTVSSQDRETCLSVADDGEFWMAMEDLCRFFSDLDICGSSPDFLDENPGGVWRAAVHEGRWVGGTTAGGCLNNRDSFWTNPQFRVNVSGECLETNTLVSLMQKHDKRNRRLVQNLHIGFCVFQIPEQFKAQTGKFPASFFNTRPPVAQTKTYMNAREVMELLSLKPGEYLIVPSTFKPNETASFILTIHSKTDTSCYENSADHKKDRVQKAKKRRNSQEEEKKRTLFRRYSDKFEEVDAERLQLILNEDVLKGDLKSGGFSIDACRSMVALMDTSITGRLNGEEFLRLWNKVVTYKDIFFRTDVSRTGTLSLSELRNAFLATGTMVSDDMLNLMALRYGASSGHMTLESFISLILRMDCMSKIFQRLSDGKGMTLRESEWFLVSMYT